MAEIVIAGGGVAALEATMALRDILGPEARITLVAPNTCFEFPAISALAPMELARTHERSMQELTDTFGVRLITAAVTHVHGSAGELQLDDGHAVSGDALLIAVGCRRVAPYRDAVALGLPGASHDIVELVERLKNARRTALVFVVPRGVTWTLPLYEAALFAARALTPGRFGRPRITIVTPEAAPLAIFGAEASAATARLLEAENVEFVGSTHADVASDSLSLMPGGGRRTGVRTITLARVVGPSLPGLPKDRHGFIPVDEHGRVRGVDTVHAAGDSVAFPIKQGGLAAQQALAAAASIARDLGAPVEPQPFRPVLRGMLVAEHPQWLRAAIAGGDGAGSVSTEALWWPGTKVAGRYLPAYLYGLDGDPITAGSTKRTSTSRQPC